MFRGLSQDATKLDNVYARSIVTIRHVQVKMDLKKSNT